MKILTWNCKLGFSKKKAEYIKSKIADLYVIQECQQQDLIELDFIFKNKSFYCDIIESNFGVGLFSDTLNFEILPEYNPCFRYIIPYRVFNDKTQFILFAVWTKDKDISNAKIEYTQQTWKAICFSKYQKYLQDSVILIGDFNSTNKQKQQPHNSQIFAKLKEYGIESAYHKIHACSDYDEEAPTLLWQMKKEQKFHCDYCFVSSDYKINSVNIGSVDEWEKMKFSDHLPVIVDLVM